MILMDSYVGVQAFCGSDITDRFAVRWGSNYPFGLEMGTVLPVSPQFVRRTLENLSVSRRHRVC